jgi:hypothetical protein
LQREKSPHCFRLGWQRCFGGNLLRPQALRRDARCFYGGTARFEFDLFSDRIVFEHYVESWWADARKYLAIVKDLASKKRPQRTA